MLLVDRGGSFAAELLTDSAGSRVVPSGGVNAGYGGAAGPDPAVRLAAGLVLALSVATAGLVAARLRPARASRDR